MRKINLLLQKQIKEHFGENVPEVLYPFFEDINESYNVLETTKNKIVLSPDDPEHNISDEVSLVKTKKRISVGKEHTPFKPQIEDIERIAKIGSWEINLSGIENFSFSDAFIKEHTHSWSEEMHRIYEIELTEQITFDKILDKIHPADRYNILDIIQQVYSEFESYKYDHRIILKDGTVRHIHVNAEFIVDRHSGKPIIVRGIAQEVTYIKKPKEESKPQPADNNTLLENIKDVLFSVDIEKNVLLYIHGAYEEVYGYSRSEFNANPSLWYDVIVEEDKAAFNAGFSLLSNGLPFDTEYCILHRSGEKRWVETKLKAILNTNGKPAKIEGVTIDITKRKVAEISLRENEYRFRTLFDNSSDMILVVDAENQVRYVNNAYYRIIGYSQEETIGSFIFKHVHPEDLPLLNKHIQIITTNPERTLGITCRIIKRSGVHIWCEGTITNLVHPGRSHEIVINFRDISERIAIENALKQSENKFRTLIENTTDAVIIINEHYDTLFANNSLYQITGFSPNEVLGKPAFDLFYKDDLPLLKNYILQLPGNNATHAKPITNRLFKKDGGFIWCEAVAANRLHDPAIRGIIFSFKNITKHVEYEEALHQSNDNLQKSNKEFDHLIHSVSHDLRAPLSSMLGIVNIMDHELSDNVVSEEISMLRTCISKLDGFIKDVLDYSRNTRNEVEMEEVIFHDQVPDIVDNLKFMESGNKNVSIKTNINDTCAFYSDRNRVNIILGNLISNAIRYSDPDKSDPFVEININISQDEAQISIKDNGIGISKEYQSKVFDMFYRLSNDAAGSGLGLYIVREAVAKLNGSIQLESETGIGTTMTVTLPNLYKNNIIM